MLQEQDKLWVKETAGKIREKMEWVSEKSKDKIPYTTVNGVHDDKSAVESASYGDGIHWWCNGFWGGMMWLMYHETGEERYCEIARRSEEKLDKCLTEFYGLHHDVGFMYLPTAVADYKLTGCPASRRRGLHAANLLAGRFHPLGRFIRAWNDDADETMDTRGLAIIDCLLNIPLLYWASDETNDPRFRQIAMMHADTVREHFVRPDGSVRHIVEFHPDTGEMVREYGGQGYGVGSSWSRGQTWGLYGFLMSYRHTGKEEYLDTAKKIAHYFIANIPEDGIIPVDFRQPREPFWCDDTAAAIAACGLLEIAREVSELESDLYRDAAVKLLRALDEKHCDYTRENDGILRKCTAAYHRDEHEYHIIYGDYYFMEAIFKLEAICGLKEKDFFMW